jgi:hypothetical protein
MDGDEKNYLVTDVKEEYDHGFDQFLDEQEIDITTFLLPPQPKCGICDTPYPFEADRVTIKECCGYMICRACGESTYYGELKRRIEDEPHIAINLNQKNLLKCPFCREIPVPSTPLRERSLENLVKRGNNEAMCQLAGLYLYHCSLLSLFECCDTMVHQVVKMICSFGLVCLSRRRYRYHRNQTSMNPYLLLPPFLYYIFVLPR